MVEDSAENELQLSVTPREAQYLLRQLVRSHGEIMAVPNKGEGEDMVYIRVTPCREEASLFYKFIRALYPDIQPENIRQEYFGGHADTHVATLTDRDIMKKLAPYAKIADMMRAGEKEQQQVRDLKLDPELEDIIINKMQRTELEREKQRQQKEAGR